ncbi:hypothetical protein RSAG8_04650, partial [Rhizoctonia solani AG-8 WAC10335]
MSDVRLTIYFNCNKCDFFTFSIQSSGIFAMCNGYCGALGAIYYEVGAGSQFRSGGKAALEMSVYAVVDK